MRKEIYYNKNLECMPKFQLRDLQNERFLKLINYVWDKQPPYRKMMEDCGICPDDIKSLDDIVKLPFTDKKFIQENYPLGLCTAPPRDIVRVHGSSGTTGNPALVACTQNDIDLLTDSFARAYCMAGCTKDSIVQNTAPNGLFIGGSGSNSAVERIGALCIPSGSGNTERQIKFLRDFKSSNLTGITSYVAHIADIAAANGYSADDFFLESILLGGERLTDAQQGKIEKVLGGKVYNIYGFAEMTAAFASCQYDVGMHIPEDYIYVEIISGDGRALHTGEYGEVVVTTLCKTGQPVIRYRTHDIACIYDDPCPCGRTMRRLSAIKCRTDDIIIYKGVKISPLQIENLIEKYPQLTGRYRITITDLSFFMEAELNMYCTMDKTLLEHELKNNLGVTVSVELKPAGKILLDNKHSIIEDKRENN